MRRRWESFTCTVSAHANDDADSLQTSPFFGTGPGDGTNPPDGPPGRVSLKDLTDVLGSMFNLPPMGGQSGNLGINDQTQQGAQAIADYLGTLHNIGDPTKGRVPGTGSSATPVITSDDLKAQARSFGQQLMKNWMQYELHQHDQTPGGPVHGGAHPTWWSDDTDKPKSDPVERSSYIGHGISYGSAIGGIIAGIAGKGAIPAIADGVVAGGMIGWAVSAWNYDRTHSHMPAPDDPGGGGPHSSQGGNYNPDPESGSGGGPRAFGSGAMPDPETGSGGGPRGSVSMPDPETGTGVGPRSVIGI